MKPGHRKGLCLIVLTLSLLHSVQASLEQRSSTRQNLYVINVPGEIDPELLSIREERQATARISGYPWEMRPEIYGFTAAPEGDSIRFPAEFDRTTKIILSWPHYAFDQYGRLKVTELLEIVRHSVDQVDVAIVLQTRTRRLVAQTLQEEGVDPQRVELITFPREFPDVRGSNLLDTIWMRDYGPQFVYTHRSKHRTNLHVIDLSYYPFSWISKHNPIGRVRDDAVPTRFASYQGIPSYRPQLIAEGGDFMTDGEGTCFVSDRLPGANARVFGPGHPWKNIFAQFFGCRRIILLVGLKGESTGHLDMFMTVLSPTTIFVGQYKPAQDNVNAERLNRNSAILTAAGYNVVRIPMPAPYAISFQRIWATFTNVVRINNRLLVPVYRNPNFPDSLREVIQKQEQEALKNFRESLPGVSVIPVKADPLIPSGGSLHCIAMNLSRAR
jgi:agmatine deiminase